MITRRYPNAYAVTVTAREIAEFNRSWPCSTLDQEHDVTFTFRDDTGDLIDVTGNAPCDGPEAVALAEDAMNEGARALGLSLIGRKCAA